MPALIDGIESPPVAFPKPLPSIIISLSLIVTFPFVLETIPNV